MYSFHLLSHEIFVGLRQALLLARLLFLLFLVLKVVLKGDYRVHCQHQESYSPEYSDYLPLAVI